MKFLLLILLSIATTCIVRADENVTAPEDNAGWPGCFGPGDGPSSRIKIGDPMFLCLHVGNNLTWSSGADFIRLSFSPKADEYSRLHVPNSYRDLVQRNGDFRGDNSLTVGVGVQTSLSFLRVWMEGSKDFDKPEGDRKVYPHLTAIIDVRDGVVRGITWDDACLFCSGFECDEITYNFEGVRQNQDSAGQLTKGCGNKISDCDSKTDATDCDLVLYVVWTGTDVDGKALLSSAYRFSAFPAQELTDRLTQNLPDAVKDAGNSNTNRDL